MKKRIFIYYSLSGNGDLVADYLYKKDIDIKKVEVNKKNILTNNMFLRIVIGGFKAFINYRDELVNFDDNIQMYDEVIIGSPIWNSRLSSPINSVLDKINLKNKKVTFILYSGSGTSKKATEKINKLFSNAFIINIKEPIKNCKELEKINV